MSEKNIWLERAKAVREAKTNNFMELQKLSGLDPLKDYRFGDWSGIDFSGCDLRGFDFTGARLRKCNFKGAKIYGSRFDQAEINGTNLREADDWEDYVSTWHPNAKQIDAAHLPSFSIFQDAPISPELIVIPPGSFMMGSKDGKGYIEEFPQHEVIIEYRLAVGRFAVTFEEWDVYHSRDPSIHRPHDKKWGRGQRPVINVNWNDAQSYVRWLSKKVGYEYRLLSEAEWEYCCRAGTSTTYWWGDTFVKEKAHRAEKTVPVNEYEPNPFGLYQMHGNVWEWCEDAWHENYVGAPNNGSAWINPKGSQTPRCVLRGGAWGSDPGILRSAKRGWNLSTIRDAKSSFRVARTL